VDFAVSAENLSSKSAKFARQVILPKQQAMNKLLLLKCCFEMQSFCKSVREQVKFNASLEERINPVIRPITPMG
jgi:hypothetical protein